MENTGLVDLGFHLKSRQTSEPLHFCCKIKTNQVVFPPNSADGAAGTVGPKVSKTGRSRRDTDAKSGSDKSHPTTGLVLR